MDTPIMAEIDQESNPLIPCPGCTTACTFSSAAQQIACPTCGWALTLDADTTHDLTLALLGLTNLRPALFLTSLAATGGRDNPPPAVAALIQGALVAAPVEAA